MIQVFVDHRIFHLLAEFFILQAAEFNEGTDVIPVFLIILSVCLKHSRQLIRHFLRNVIGNFIDESIVLQGAS